MGSLPPRGGFRPALLWLPLLAPPSEGLIGGDGLARAADRLDRERAGVGIGADVDPAGVRADVIDPVGRYLAQLPDEVVGIGRLRGAAGCVLRTAIGKPPDVFLLLRVDRDHRQPSVGERAD